MRVVIWIHVYGGPLASQELAERELQVEAEVADLMSLDFGRAAQERISAALAEAEIRSLENEKE